MNAPRLPIVQVAVNVPGVGGVFDYHLPLELDAGVEAGSLVVVPFGSQQVQALVLRRAAEASVPETRPVLQLLDPRPVITPLQMRLAEALAHQTLAPLSACLELMLPPGVGRRADTLHTPLAPPSPAAREGLSPLQRRVLEELERRGALRGRQLEAAFPHQNWKSALGGLQKRGWVRSSAVLPEPGVRPKTVRTAQIACSPQEAAARFEGLGRGPAGERRRRILEFLIEEAVPVQAAWVYSASGGNLQDLMRLAEEGLVVLREEEVLRDPLERVDTQRREPPVLTAEQEAALQALRRGLDNPGAPFLLHGVTGSGKTEIYLQAAAEALRRGRQAVILVPEISLTPQTVRRFLERFPGQVGLVHSQLSDGERYDTWRRARDGRLSLLVGARSALFAPLPNPGLIVVDECHDSSYYQSDTPPYYNAVQAAHEYARLADAVLLLGSATPGVSLYFQAQRGAWQVLSLPRRVLAHRQALETSQPQLSSPTAAWLPLPPVKVVDMRQELKAGNRSMFSRDLQSALQDVLARGQQAILFLNRRGAATYVFCRDCGYSLLCPRCSLPLTYHTSSAGLVCHHCNYRRQMPGRCPQCGGAHIQQYGAGTEKVESELLKLFPQARSLRWDAGTTRGRGAHDILLSHFVNHRADVLIGTQMLAKGLDLPLVTLVGVVLAEVGLDLPDYRAAERTFQLLTQVAGRAGRSALGGQVIFQTFQPDAYAVRLAAEHDFEGFYRQELAHRQKIGYPPFSRLARLEFRRPGSGAAEAAARSAAARIAGWIAGSEFSATEIIGPLPCFFERLNGEERWQVILRGSDPAGLLRGRSLEDCRVEVNPQSLL